MTVTDPVERIVALALTDGGVEFVTDAGGGNPAGLDFYLPAWDLHIEVKRFHSPRIAEQMSRAENVIAVQGAAAVVWLGALIRASRALDLSDDGAGVPVRTLSATAEPNDNS